MSDAPIQIFIRPDLSILLAQGDVVLELPLTPEQALGLAKQLEHAAWMYRITRQPEALEALHKQGLLSDEDLSLAASFRLEQLDAAGSA